MAENGDCEDVPKGNQAVGRHKKTAHTQVWHRFLPAILAYPVWIYALTKNHAWEHAFGTYYPLTLAMALGSLVAGSTPLGGGVIAFPVSVLFINFQPAQGRDFSLIIQSAGMTAASFLLVFAKRELCHTWLILWFTLSAIFGMIIGFEIELSGFIINIVFTTAVTCFAMAFAYRNYIAGHATQKTSAKLPHDAWELIESGRFPLADSAAYRLFGSFYPFALTVSACSFGVVGGFLTSKLGSGADMLAYIFGVFVWNTTCPAGAELPDNMLTASSVIVMACCSIFGVLLRITTEGMSTEVYLCWGACVPIVILGAPLGSLLLTPRMTKTLRQAFYLLSAIQIVSFGILRIKDNLQAWIAIGCTIILTSP